MIKAVLFDFTGVVADIRRSFIGEDGAAWVIEPVVPVIEVIALLRAGGTRTCLVSNNDRDALLELATNIDFDTLFDVLVFSSDCNAEKPNRRIYEHALNLLGLAAEECMFVDDLARNVDTALQLGMQGIVADRSESVTEALKLIS